MNTTHVVFVMQADTDEMKVQYRKETSAMSNLRLCFPCMEGQINCMHSKLMLLSFPQHLRVVVPTANLVPYDWGETGIMENTVFLIDLPRLSADKSVALGDDMTDFAKDLIYFLQAIGLEQTIIDSIRRFDFSATKDLAFVHTIGGAHAGAREPWRRTGYCGLGRAISQLRLASDEFVNIDYITSSVGSLNLDFLMALYLAAQGDDGLSEYTWRTHSSSKTAKVSEENDLLVTKKKHTQKAISNGFRIYYPSFETIKASKGGSDNGGTICFQSKWWKSPTFPRELLRDCTSRREGLLMHNKIIYVYPSPHEDAHSPSTSWAYIGSANCSESAWGKLVKDRGTKQPKLNCRNWECGVVVPLRRAVMMNPEYNPGYNAVPGSVAQHHGSYEGFISTPMQWPGKDYGDGRIPWFNPT
ncbi:MAG: hypothetical protein Q9223_005160 [Gallowayella weberi]